MNLLHARDISVLFETPTIYDGTNGTKLGRCADRGKLEWPSGAWDSEPDVIAWHYKDMMPMIARAADGRWCAYLFGVSPSIPTVDGLAVEANIPIGSIRIFVHGELVALGGLDYWGMSAFAGDEVWSAYGYNLIIEASGTAPVDANKVRTIQAARLGEGYVDAAAKLAQLARLLKVIDPLLDEASEPVSIEATDACMLNELALLDAVLR